MNDNQDDQTNTSVLSRPKGLRAATKYIEVHMRTHIDQHNHEIVILSWKNQNYEKNASEVRLPTLDETNSFASMRIKA